MLPKERRNSLILLKIQESAQKCWKSKIMLQIRKSAERNRDMPRGYVGSWVGRLW